VFQVGLDFSALPRVADFKKARGDQARQTVNILKPSDDAGPSFELPIALIDHLVDAHFFPMLRGQVKNGGALRDVVLAPPLSVVYYGSVVQEFKHPEGSCCIPEGDATKRRRIDSII